MLSKTANPPNCPELRIFEKYWGIIKQKMKKTKELCKNIKGLKISWEKASNIYDCNAVRKLGPPKQKFDILLDVLRNILISLKYFIFIY